MYADDTVIFCSVLTLAKAIEHLQSAFNVVQNILSQLKLKLMLFSNAKYRRTEYLFSGHSWRKGYW